jgi:hypothetical protein
MRRAIVQGIPSGLNAFFYASLNLSVILCYLDYRMNRTIMYSVNVVTNMATQRILFQS